MKVRFLGAVNGDVTGSCIHFQYERTKTQFLIDCGMFQGEWKSKEKNHKKFLFDPKDIKFVILTHAHLDHCGLIPKLYRDGFDGDIICTAATSKLAFIQLIDSCKHVNLLYEEKHVNMIRFRCVDEQSNFGLSRFISIDEDLKASFTRSSHILGSVSVNIGWINQEGEWENIAVSGDIGGSTKENPYNSLLAGGQTPYGSPKYAVLESTYGSKTREPEFSFFEYRIKKIQNLLYENITKNDKMIIIPAFSLQRTQEILIDLFYILGRNNDYNFTDEKLNFKISRLTKCCDEKGLPEFAYEIYQSLLSFIPNDIYNDWADAFEKRDVDGKISWHLKSDAKISFEEIINFAKSFKPIEIVIDSPLSHKMTPEFGSELCRRQIVNPEETLYRNKLLQHRFKKTEHQIDIIIKKIFPNISHDEEMIKFGRHKIRYTKQYNLPEHAELKNKGVILISGSGMCEGGPIINHLKHSLERDDVLIATTGFMARESLGNKLISISNSQQNGTKYTISNILVGDKKINTEDIKAKILQLGPYYSGHGDLKTLILFIKNKFCDKSEQEIHKKTIFLTHGDESSRLKLKSVIEEFNNDGKHEFSVMTPSNDYRWFDLDNNEWMHNSDNISNIDTMLAYLYKEQKRTNELLENIIKILNPEYNLSSTIKNN